MIKIELAKTAGFCFGVNRAMNYIYSCIENNEKICTIGPIIHNSRVVDDLKQNGVYPVNSLDEIKPGYKAVIRTHGVEKDVMNQLVASEIPYSDQTCPFVLKIHQIVMSAPQGTITLIAGDENHPEVRGIRSRCVGDSYVFVDEKQLIKILSKPNVCESSSLICVSQTTFDKKTLENCLKLIKKVCTNCKTFDTICNATFERQAEARKLSENCDAMVVIGGHHSSNTCKLADVSSELAPTFHIESADELAEIDFTPYNIVGVTAGASTPSAIIKEVLETMSEEIKNTEEAEEAEVEAAAKDAETQEESVESALAQGDVTEGGDEDSEKPVDAEAETGDEESFAEILEESMRDYVPNKVVKGTVVNITPSEVYVDVPNRKQAGIIEKEDLSFEDFENCSDVVSVGDEIDLLIMKVDDQSGILKLSKRLVDRYKVWADIYSAKDTGKILEGTVTGAHENGVFVNIKGAGIFVPSALTGLRRGEPNNQLVGQKVKLKIRDTNKQKQHATGSIKDVLKEEELAAKEAVWDSLKEGMVVKGIVKTIKEYGAFVDVGCGVTGLLHISEMSWGHSVKHPTDILSVGQEIETTILSLNKEQNKLSLSLKNEGNNPWEIIKRDYAVGDVIDVKIVNITDFGAFAEIIPDVEGLIHISQISLNRIKSPSECLSVGDVVSAKIVDINYETQRVGLSIKALLQKKEQETMDAEREEIEKYLLNQSTDESVDEPESDEEASPESETAKESADDEPVDVVDDNEAETVKEDNASASDTEEDTE